MKKFWCFFWHWYVWSNWEARPTDSSEYCRKRVCTRCGKVGGMQWTFIKNEKIIKATPNGKAEAEASA